MERCFPKNGRYLLSGILGVLLLWTSLFGDFVSPVQAGTPPGPIIAVIIDGKGISTDVTPVVKNGRVLVPIRMIAENTGSKVSYEEGSQRILVTSQETEMALFVGQRFAFVNGKKVGMDTAPLIVRGRTMVPLRFLNQQLGFEVSWDKQSQVAIVNTGKNAVQTVRSIDDPVTTDAILAKTDEKDLLSARFIFPFGKFGRYETFYNTYGDERSWTEKENTPGRQHEGIDIMAEKGTPIYAASDGVINRIGWNTYGGWRINITDKSGKYKLYYAHLNAFVPSLRLYGSVKAGQLIGFVGDSGYGVPGTTGMFPPHLHFGLYYNGTEIAFNPFYYLKQWEQQTVHN